ncbi:MAG: beta-propeller fold lactonase family protein [Candidatus Rokubacteria bacterium]|nr:beta-propeller fold lactonase family protein [Candidatus Rokubacteria bacterium]
MRRPRWIAAAALMAVAGWAGPAGATPEKIYVADEEASTVSVIDARLWTRSGVVPVGRAPHNVQVSPNGKLAWVTNNGEEPKEWEQEHKGMAKREHDARGNPGEVWAIDTATDKVVAKVRVGLHPAHVVLTPDSRFAYVTNGGESTVSVVDTQSRRVVATIPVGASPHGIRLSPDGKEAYVANLKGETVSVIDTGARLEVAKIPVGKGPAQVGFTPDGRLAFVSLSQEDRVAVIDPKIRQVVRKVAVGTVPIQVYATPDSRLLFVANQGTKKSPGRTVSAIDLGTFEVTKSVETEAGAHGVVVSGDGRYAYVTNIYANSVSVIEVKDLKVIATVPVGEGPNGISVTP